MYILVNEHFSEMEGNFPLRHGNIPPFMGGANDLEIVVSQPAQSGSVPGILRVPLTVRELPNERLTADVTDTLFLDRTHIQTLYKFTLTLYLFRAPHPNAYID